MPYSLDDKLVIAISSRALFALDEADQVFREQGLAAYREYQREREDEPLAPGTGMPLVRGLLRINAAVDQPLVEVIVLSRNDADSGLRILNTVEALGLSISRAAFTDGADPLPYLEPFMCDLFLSDEVDVVRGAITNGFPAAQVLDPPEAHDEAPSGPVKVAFDGDAVLFDGQSEKIYQTEGIEAFHAREHALADTPMNPGPFQPFLSALGRVQREVGDDQTVIRTALVTARNAPATKRVVNTLRTWDVRVDESFFLGGVDKAGVLAALKPHIFFDDQYAHLTPARGLTPSAYVPSGEDGTTESATS